jgi:hypothetical protein
MLSGTPEADAHVRSALEAGMDWDALQHQARQHNVVPLLHTWLGRHAADLAPPDRLAALRSEYHSIVARNMQLTHALQEALGALEAAGIAAIPVKGPVLALQAYGDITRRQFCDLDVLVRPPDLARAQQALEGIGYESPSGLSGERLARVGARVLAMVELVCGTCLVELHTAALERRLVDSIPGGQWWEGTETVGLAGLQFPCLSRVNSMLLCAIHGTKHQWVMLKWVADLAALLAGASAAERERLGAEAERFGLGRLVARAVELAEALRNDPEIVERRLTEAEQARPTRAELALERMTGMAGLGERLMNTRLFLELRDRRRDVWPGYLSQVFCPHPEDIAAVALPGWLAWLYTPLRVSRLVGRAVWKRRV